MTSPVNTDLGALLAHSRFVITALQEPNGAYPASPDFSAYRGYCWFRDGAFIADGASAAGAVESATAFFDWCAGVLLRHEDAIEGIIAAARAGDPVPDDQMLPARFTFAGELGHDDWWDFQLDGYGTWLWAAVAHSDRHGLDGQRWRRAAELTVDYLVSSWQRPCFDWWEEHSERVHVSTLGCIAAGLTAAASSGLIDGERLRTAIEARAAIDGVLRGDGTADGHLVKWIGDDAVDGSLSAVVAPLGVIPAADPLAAGTITAIEQDLSVDGGVHRFLADTFFGGGQWPLLTCFLGLAKAAAGDRDGAWAALDWAAGTATTDLMLPEQVNRHLLHPSFRQEWIDRWGTVATPLLWSHAMLLRLAAELGEVPA